MAIDIPDDWPTRRWVEDTPIGHLETFASGSATAVTWQVSSWETTREIASSSLPGQIRHKTGLSVGTGKAVVKRDGNDYPWKRRMIYNLSGSDAQILFAPEGRTEIPTGQFKVAEVSGDLTTLGVQVDLDEKQIEGRDKTPMVSPISIYDYSDGVVDPAWWIAELAEQMGFTSGNMPMSTEGYNPIFEVPMQGSASPKVPAGVFYSDVTQAGLSFVEREGMIGLQWEADPVTDTSVGYQMETYLPQTYTVTWDLADGWAAIFFNDVGAGTAFFDVYARASPDDDSVRLFIESLGDVDTTFTYTSVPRDPDTPLRMQIEVTFTPNGTGGYGSASVRVRRDIDDGWTAPTVHTITANPPPIDDPYEIEIQLQPWDATHPVFLSHVSVVDNATTSATLIDQLLTQTGGPEGRIYLEPLGGSLLSPWIDPTLTVWSAMQAIVEAWQGALITDVYGDLHLLSRFSLTGSREGQTERAIDVGLSFEDLPWTMDRNDMADRLVIRYRPALELSNTAATASVVYEFTDVLTVNPGANEFFINLDYIYPLDETFQQFVRKDFDDGFSHVWDAYRYSNGSGTHIDPGTGISMRVDVISTAVWKVYIVNHTAEPFYMVDSSGAPYLKLRSTFALDQRQEQVVERGTTEGEARNALEIDLSNYVQTADDAGAIADFIWGRVRSPLWRASSVSMVPDYHLDLGDVVEITHRRTGMKSNALVANVSLAGQPGQVTQTVDLILIPSTWEDFDEAWETLATANSRINEITNPSVEVNATGWQSNSAFGGYDVSAVARSTAQAWVGSASLQVTTPTPAVGKTWANFASTPTTPGETYTFSMYVYSPVEATFYADAVFVNRGPDIVVSPGIWTRVSTTFVAASAGTFCGVGIDGAPAGFVYYIDGALLENVSTVGDYFDGATTDTAEINYAWEGSANASRSLATPVDTGNTWDDFDALWAPYTWDDFDRTPTATTVSDIEEAL
jgi:hypothetical protein